VLHRMFCIRCAKLQDVTVSVISTLTEVFPCFFLSCTNARVKPAKMGHGPHSTKICVVVRIFCFVSFCVLLVCKCVLYYCHRVATQLQLINISYHFQLKILSTYGLPDFQLLIRHKHNCFNMLHDNLRH
jgi:hypothetical protein